MNGDKVEPVNVKCPIESCEGNVFARQMGGSSGLGCDGPDQHGDATIRGIWRRGDELELAAGEAASDELLRRVDPTAWVKDKIALARTVPDEYIKWVDLKSVTYLPKYSHGFVDYSPDGKLLHLQGMTTLSGKASAGKSWFALAAGLRSAAEGWDTHYIAAEASDVIVRRVKESKAQTQNFSVHEVEPGMTPDHLIDAIEGWIERPRTLLIFDSISTLLGLMSIAPGASKWDNQSTLEMFLMRIRSLTRGWVSIINLSEANAAGETKGRSLDHRSDIAINFESCSEERAVKTVTVVKSWEGFTGALGYARVDWREPGLELSEEGPNSGEEESKQW